MLGDVWTKTLWDKRRSLLGWTLGFFAVALIYGGFYPLASTPEYEDLLRSLPAGMAEALGWDEIATPHGYLGSTVYGLLGPALAIIMGVAFGAWAIAGDEEEGSLDLILTHPKTRGSVVAQRSLALVLAMLGAGLVVFLAILLLGIGIDFDLSFANIGAASLNLALLGTLFGLVALATGAISGRKGLSIGVATVTAVVAFLANSLAPQVEGLAWLQEASPFHWFDGSSTLRAGLDPLNTVLLVATPLVLLAVALFAFERRDVGV